MEQVEIKTTHSFCDGVYARQITIPAGVCLIGAKHKTSFFMVISSGVCHIKTDNSEETLTAPHTAISEVGAKRAITALQDTVLTTFHPTNETDIKKIEFDIIESEGLEIANNPDHIKLMAKNTLLKMKLGGI